MLFKRKDSSPDMNDIMAAMDEPVEEMPTPSVRQPAPADSNSAPLFVKVDKYREILTTVQEMKLFISSVKQLFTVLNEVETVRADAINVMRATIQRLEKDMFEVDSRLLRPKGVSLTEMGIATSEVRHVEDTLTDLQKQLAELRSELHGLR